MLIELNVKTRKDLDKYLGLLKSELYEGVSITCKKGNLDLDFVINYLSKSYSICNANNFQIIPTFSCAVNYDTNVDKTYIKFLEFEKIMESFDIKNCLLVSGNPKRTLNTNSLLNLIQQNKTDLTFGVAYNPYSLDLDSENQRLIEKLTFANVNQVWLQLGQDCQKLKTSIEFIRKVKPKIQIINSILMPTPNLLQSLRFRPWSGVYYTDEFYNNIEFALQNVGDMKQLSHDLKLEILISGV